MIATMGDAEEIPGEIERREVPRHRYLGRARLTLHGDRDVTLYTRDVTARGVGFIANGELQPEVRGTVAFNTPAGQPVQVEGQLVRAHTIAQGWHEGYVEFDRPVRLFCETPIRAA